MEAVSCLHRERVDSTPALPGIEIGICSKCGQTIQYDHNAVPTKVSVTKLGRKDGNIVIPKPGLRLLLSAEDKKDLETVLSAATAEPAPAPPPRRRQKRKSREEYFEQNREVIIYDYYLMPLLDFFKKWGLCSHTWKRLKAQWEVAPKGPVNKYTRATKKSEHEREPKPEPKPGKALPSFPPFNEDWTPQVKIEWFRTYKELSLASGEK